MEGCLKRALKHLSSISSPESHTGGELEAEFLLKCYEAVGPQSQDNNIQGTTSWLYSLAEFWKARGDRAKEAELRYRWADDQKKLGIVHFLSGYDYAAAAWAFADKQEFGRAAETMEKAALIDHSIPRKDPNFGFWYSGAKLYEKAGNREKAAELYVQCGQSAKASRLRGTLSYDTTEAGTVAEALNVPGDSKDWILKKAEELARGHAVEDSAGSLLQELEKEKGVCGRIGLSYQSFTRGLKTTRLIEKPSGRSKANSETEADGSLPPRFICSRNYMMSSRESALKRMNWK